MAKYNNKVIPNTEITLKEFKEMLFEQFKGYPMMYVDYKRNQFVIKQTYYDNISITQKKLVNFCNKFNIACEAAFHKVIIDLAS